MGVSLSHLFIVYLNQHFTQVYVALIHGPRAGKLFKDGEVIHLQSETIAVIYNICNITPSAIALCTILVCYC